MQKNPLLSLLADALFSEIAHAREAGNFPAVGAEYDFLTYALFHGRASKAQLAQDLWVLFELKGQHGGYFVEFGAGNGVNLSNTWLLEHDFGWQGVLAEPNPVFHEDLFRNRRCFTSTKCVVGNDASEVVFNQTTDPHLATIDSYTTSDMHLTRRISGTRITVPAQSLMDLLREAGAPRRIDYMSLDTEGSEFEIMRNFDFNAYDVNLITVEHNFTPQREQLRDLLNENGFIQRFPGLTRFDDWYIHERVFIF
jgi:FkbM family methyltransferase